MPSIDQPPAGYCPFCDYPINAGLCPECGEFIPLEKLRMSMRKHRIRHAILRGFKYTIILALVGGLGYGIYHEIQPDRWVRYVSTDYLIDLETRGAGDHVKFELDRRHVEDLLTDKELDQVLRLRYEVPLISLRSPWPVGLTPRLENQHPCDQYDIGTEVRFHGSPIVENDEIWLRETRFASIQYQSLIESDFFRKIRSLPAGKYTFERRQTLSTSSFPFSNYQYGGTATKFPRLILFKRSFTATTSFTLTLVGKSPDEMVRGGFDEGRRQALLKIDIFEDPIDQAAIDPIAQIRSHQLAGFLKIKSNVLQTGLGSTAEFRIPHDVCHMHRTIAAHGPAMQNVGITFTPDAATALEVDYDDYFKGIIRWKNVNLFEGFGLPDSIEPMPVE